MMTLLLPWIVRVLLLALLWIVTLLILWFVRMMSGYYCPSLIITLPPLEWMVRFVPPVVLIMPVEAEPSLGSKVIP